MSSQHGIPVVDRIKSDIANTCKMQAKKHYHKSLKLVTSEKYK